METRLLARLRIALDHAEELEQQLLCLKHRECGIEVGCQTDTSTQDPPKYTIKKSVVKQTRAQTKRILLDADQVNEEDLIRDLGEQQARRLLKRLARQKC